MANFNKDLRSIFKGLELVAKECVKIGKTECTSRVQNSPLLNELRRLKWPKLEPSELAKQIPNYAKEVNWRSKAFAKQIKIEYFTDFSYPLEEERREENRKGEDSVTSNSGRVLNEEGFPAVVGTSGGNSAAAVANNPSVLREIPVEAVSIQKSEIGKQRRVPSSRIGRLASFSGLAAGLGWDYLFNKLWTKQRSTISKESAARLVDTLCKVRGAALKLGQMLSIQDESLVSPEILQIFERVRQQADFMPERQLQSVMRQEIGPDWRDKYRNFNERPFASASIGQVHKAVLLDGTEVAVKVQYPGVARSIDSDIDNLTSVLKYSNIFPAGLYLDQMLVSLRRELKQEVNYIKEAQNQRRFRSILADDPCFYVPRVIDHLSTERVLTSEFVHGITLENVVTMPENIRNAVAKNFLRLCLQELFVWNFMQTDPNWANFLVTESGVVNLIDFGACREFDKAKFVDNYIEIIKAASVCDRDRVYWLSLKLGFLTGLEDEKMKNTHVDAVMLLGEAFRLDKPFNFGKQDTTRKIMKMIPTMVEKRLSPPPEETYSLHRKMSGAFLACAKLKANINCKPIFDRIYADYVPASKI